MTEDTKKTEKKKAVWTKLGDLAIVTFPSGKEAKFDLTKLDTMVVKFYGAKQILADSVASAENEEDKIAGMKAWYKDATESGLELTETGRVAIIGKVRSNAGVGTALKAAKSMVELLMKKVSGETLTEEEQKTLDGMIETKKKVEEAAKLAAGTAADRNPERANELLNKIEKKNGKTK